MEIIHISEAEATRDFVGIMAKVRAGAEVRIGDGDAPLAVLRISQEDAPKKTLSEAIRHAKLRQSKVLLDDHFGRDLEAVILQHEREGRRDLWEE